MFKLRRVLSRRTEAAQRVLGYFRSSEGFSQAIPYLEDAHAQFCSCSAASLTAQAFRKETSFEGNASWLKRWPKVTKVVAREGRAEEHRSDWRRNLLNRWRFGGPRRARGIESVNHGPGVLIERLYVLWEESECCLRGRATAQLSVRTLGRHWPLMQTRREGRIFVDQGCQAENRRQRIDARETFCMKRSAP